MTVRVHQLLSGAGAHDAITTEALAFRAHFKAWGWGGGDHAYRITPGLGGGFRTADRLEADPSDVLLLHHSAGWPRLGELLALPNPKLLLYHNVTPPQWLWEHAPAVAAQCATGREQLAELVRAVEVAAADSAFNAGEMVELGARRTEVIPLLVKLDSLGTPGPEEPPGPPTVIFVGRLSPHKRQDELIRAFALYRRHRAPDARLSLIGPPVYFGYEDTLRRLGEALAPGAVEIASGLTPDELGARYRSARVFACMSEHEGFCIPLLEAFHFGVPVLSRPAGAIPEVTGDAAVLVDDRDPAVVAELMHLLATDVPLRRELRRRGRARLSHFDPAEIGGRLRRAVEETIRVAAASGTRA